MDMSESFFRSYPEQGMMLRSPRMAYLVVFSRFTNHILQ